MHPIVLYPHHPITKLIIQDGDSRLKHSGPDRVFAELRRRFWILRGRQAVRKHQHGCAECRRWHSNPVIPSMADLHPSSLRLSKPALHSVSTGVAVSSSADGRRRSRSRTGPTRGPLQSDSHHSRRMQLAHFRKTTLLRKVGAAVKKGCLTSCLQLCTPAVQATHGTWGPGRGQPIS